MIKGLSREDGHSIEGSEVRYGVRHRRRALVVAGQVLNVPAHLVIGEAGVVQSRAVTEGQELPDG